jgi:hypothetical protein
VATSFNRLAADLPHSDGHVEAPGPDIIMLGDLGKDHDPSDDIGVIALKPGSSNAWLAVARQPRSPRLRNPDQLRRGERYRRAGLRA